jgi:myo-inositol 2-dehydrogenase/D-chiro-inositol 1-dehydrogenase
MRMADAVRFGLIGYGLWGRHHAAALAAAPGAVLSAIACASEATAAAAAGDFPAAAVEVGYQALLDRADIDAVVVAVPNYLHAEIGVAALQAGKHVLLEKPMATTVQGCDALIEAARGSGRILTIGHELRFSAQYGRIKEMIDGRDIGMPGYANFSLFRFPFRPGSQGWRYDPARVGSWILEEPVHAVDLAMWYFAELGDPLSVRAFGTSASRDASMPQSFTAILGFGGAAHAVITQTTGGFEYHQVLSLVGSEGSIRSLWSGAMDRAEHPTFELRIKRRGKNDAEAISVGPSGELVELFEQARQTVAAFRQRRSLFSGEEARKRIIVCLAAEQSLREGREIRLQF